jgi:hypothetical protein
MFSNGVIRSGVRSIIAVAEHAIGGWRAIMMHRPNPSIQKVNLFLSHAQQDKEIAEELAKWIEKTFFVIKVFVSSRWGSIEMGDDFLATILEEIRHCKLGMVLATPNSLSRPWVNFEVGGFHALNKKLIPVCISPTTLQDLPAPIDRKQACEYSDVGSRLTLFRNIAKLLGQSDKEVEASVTRELAESAPKLEARHLLPSAAEPGPSPTEPAYLRGGHGGAIESLFKTHDRWKTVIYTCRATFSKDETCPDCEADAPRGKSLRLHVPVDEVQTVCAAVNHLMPVEDGATEGDILRTVMCSKVAEELARKPRNSGSEDPPHLLDRDLVVVGENNFSNLLLHKMKPYLPWESSLSWESKDPNHDPARPKLTIQIAEHAQYTLKSFHNSIVTKGGGMICVFPSPFNLRKRVAVLFGCHREGQFAVEQWLRSEGVRPAVLSLASKVPPPDEAAAAIQIVIQSGDPIPRGGRLPQAWKTLAIPNSDEGGSPFWLTPLKAVGPSEALQVNTDCATAGEMYDISLIAELTTEDRDRLAQVVMRRVGAPDLYWESRECELGFHITLYEFCTKDAPGADLRFKLDQTVNLLRAALTRTGVGEAPSSVRVSVRGMETLPRAVISYVDFPSDNVSGPNWLATLRCWCEEKVKWMARQAGQHDGILDGRRIPFPAHITLCRFNRPIDAELAGRLEELSRQSRYEELLQLDVKSLSLVVGRRRPYRDVKVVHKIALT